MAELKEIVQKPYIAAWLLYLAPLGKTYEYMWRKATFTLQVLLYMANIFEDQLTSPFKGDPYLILLHYTWW